MLSHRENGVATLIAGLTRVEGGVRWIDTATSPIELDRLGRLIAEGFAEQQPEAVVCWNSADEAVLAHVVARHLKIPVSRLDSDLGLLQLDPALSSETKCVLVLATSWTASRSPYTLIAMLENLGVQIAALVALLPGGDRPANIPADTPYLLLGGQ